MRRPSTALMGSVASLAIVFALYAGNGGAGQDSQPPGSGAEGAGGTAQPRYTGHGLSFCYGPGLSPETDTSKGTVSVTLKGNSDLLLMVQLADLPLSGDLYAESLVEGMRGGMEASGATVGKIQTVKERVAGKDRPGTGFSYQLAGVEMFYQACGWDPLGGRGVRKVVVVSVQYPSRAKTAVRPLIETTLGTLTYTSN